MDLADIILIVAVSLLLVLFLAVPILKYWKLARNRKLRTLSDQAAPTSPAAMPDSIKSDMDRRIDSGGTRVQDTHGSLQTGYRSVDPQQDLLVREHNGSKNNGNSPHE